MSASTSGLLICIVTCSGPTFIVSRLGILPQVRAPADASRAKLYSSPALAPIALSMLQGCSIYTTREKVKSQDRSANMRIGDATASATFKASSGECRIIALAQEVFGGFLARKSARIVCESGIH